MIRPVAVSVLISVMIGSTVMGEEYEISSLEELARLGQASGNVIKMKPGVYRFTDYMSRDALKTRRKGGEYSFMKFTGSDNRFDLRGVTIEVDVSIRGIGRPPVHTSEFVFTGEKITLVGVTITNVGEGISPGGAVISNLGNANTFKDVTLHVSGSRPYGYGDLFGKGGYKQSGFHLTGNDNRVIGCRLFMRSFGHGFYVQKGATNNLFENCYVEGVMRTTDEMLKEKSGIGVDRAFRTVFKNREGVAKITPGYMKCLAEDGFRTYDTIKGLTLRNCTAKHMRGGFEIRTKAGATLEDCTAIACERGFWVADGTTVSNCRGDAKYGPLLFVEGKGAKVEVTLLGDESKMKVHALATVRGEGHRIEINASKAGRRSSAIPIKLGYSAPPAGEAMAPYSEKKTRGVVVVNKTRMPAEFGRMAERCLLETRGAVLDDRGKENEVKQLADK